MLGCSIEEFKKYIEDQFSDGVNWESYPKVWQIKYVKPITETGISEEELLNRLNYNNIKIYKMKVKPEVKPLVPPIMNYNGESKYVDINESNIGDFIDQIIELLNPIDKGSFKLKNIENNRINFERTKSSFCDLCVKTHRDGSLIYLIIKNNKIRKHCTKCDDDDGNNFFINLGGIKKL